MKTWKRVSSTHFLHKEQVADAAGSKWWAEVSVARTPCSSCYWNSPVLLVMGSLYMICQARCSYSGVAAIRHHFRSCQDRQWRHEHDTLLLFTCTVPSQTRSQSRSYHCSCLAWGGTAGSRHTSFIAVYSQKNGQWWAGRGHLSTELPWGRDGGHMRKWSSRATGSSAGMAVFISAKTHKVKRTECRPSWSARVFPKKRAIDKNR